MAKVKITFVGEALKNEWGGTHTNPKVTFERGKTVEIDTNKVLGHERPFYENLIRKARGNPDFKVQYLEGDAKGKKPGDKTEDPNPEADGEGQDGDAGGDDDGAGGGGGETGDSAEE